MEEVCRLCLADTRSCDKYTSYDGRIHLLMPEIDLNITPTFNLCEDCSDTLNNAYTFKQKCLQVEERINNYIRKAQTPLTNLRCVRDQTYKYIKESLDEDDVNIKEEYDKDDSNSITNWSNVEDYKDIDSISEEYHLTFPKDEIVSQYKDEYASNRREEGRIEEICKESFKSSTELETNIFANDSCNKKCSKDPSLTVPTIITPDKMHPYFCHICNKGFKCRRKLDNHKVIHTNKKTYTCPICSKTCRYLKDHIQNSHNKKHICQVCNKQHGSKRNLQQHMLRHTGERPYKCEICGKDFLVEKSLDDHMSTHQTTDVEKRFLCKITTCNGQFRTERLLYQHMRVHLSRKHQCSLCDKSFLRPSQLKWHMCTHTGEKPFECHICHKHYGRKNVLRQHLKSHERMKICN